LRAAINLRTVINVEDLNGTAAVVDPINVAKSAPVSPLTAQCDLGLGR
jgi:hypothetical protein